MNTTSDLFGDTQPAIRSGALLSPCGLYRYRLWRVWEENGMAMVFVMQNPSTADAEKDDPTIRKCVGFAKKHGYGGIVVMNVFAYRATDERELLTVADPVGPDNAEHLLSANSIALGSCLVAAWGNRMRGRKGSSIRDAYCSAANICRMQRAVCLGVTKSGDPKHPLFVPYSAEMLRWATPTY